MHISTQLDLDVIAVETDDQVSLLIELTAPTAEARRSARRAPWWWSWTEAARWRASGWTAQAGA